MPKSKDAFRTISEVAEWLETPAHVLRFWESKFTQVKPVKRAGGRRYYRPADMRLLGGIKKLLHDDGLTIKGAQKLLREHGVKHVAGLSQPLEEDLLDSEFNDGSLGDANVFQEAAYELDVQPEPIVEEPARVLTFPSRTEQKTEQRSEPDAAPPQQETAAPAAPITEPTSRPEAPQTPAATETPEAATASDSEEQTDGSPAFGSDALPAFLRRSPATPPQAPAQPTTQTPIQTPGQISGTSESHPAAPKDEPAKVTINPTAHFEPVEVDATPAPLDGPADPVETNTTTDETPVAETQAPLEVTRHAAQDNATPSVDTTRQAAPASDEADVPEITEAPETTTEPVDSSEPEEVDAAPETAPPLMADIPAAARVAPTLESYDAPAGVLGALPVARRLSPELANALAEQLSELRALRDRMQSH